MYSSDQWANDDHRRATTRRRRSSIFEWDAVRRDAGRRPSSTLDGDGGDIFESSAKSVAGARYFRPAHGALGVESPFPFAGRPSRPP